ncbi:MAG: DMT family transporter [Patescibacteria group bacterium]
MVWITFALLTHFFWAVVNIAEKYFVDKRFRNPYIYILLAFMAGPLFLVVLPFMDFFVPAPEYLLWILFISVCFVFGAIFYIKALKAEEVTRVNILWNFIPIFTLVGAWFFIDEKLGAKELVGFFILMAASVVASLHVKGGGKIKISPAFFWMALACVFFAAYDVVARYLSSLVPFSVIFLWMTIFMPVLAFSFFISKKFRLEFKEEKKNLTWRLVALVAGVTMISKLGLLFNIKAISLGQVALVNAMEGSQALFVFIFVVLFSLFAPRILKEELDRRNVILKLAAIVFMVAGVAVLALG